MTQIHGDASTMFRWREMSILYAHNSANCTINFMNFTHSVVRLQAFGMHLTYSERTPTCETSAPATSTRQRNQCNATSL